MACLPVPRSEAGEFGVMKVDESDRIIEFLEKPADPPAMPGNPDMSLASMGIYILMPPTCSSYWKRICRPRLQPRFRQGSDPENHRATGGVGASVYLVLRDFQPRSAAVLARRRHAGCLLARQPRSGVGDAGAGHVRPRLADPHPWSRYRRPSSCRIAPAATA